MNAPAAVTVGEMQLVEELLREIAGHRPAVDGDGSRTDMGPLVQLVRPEDAVVPLGRDHETHRVAQHVAEQREDAGRQVVRQFVPRGVQR